MEAIFFTLGIASVFATALAVSTIWAVVKVVKLRAQLDEYYLNTTNSQFDIHNQINTIEQGLYREISDTNTSLDTRLDKLVDALTARDDENRRYTDSRIDKLLNDPRFCLNDKNTKQLING